MIPKPGPLLEQNIKIDSQESLDWSFNGKTKTPSIWQILALMFCEFIRFAVFTAPGGCGKTILAIIISMNEVIKSKNTRKHLFIAPMIDIAENFCTYKNKDIKLLFKGKERTWSVPPEYKFNSDNTKSIKGLRDFLLSKPKKFLYDEYYFKGSYATATHQGIVKIWSEFTEDEKKIALKNITIHIDECHHSKSTVLDPTKLGAFVRDICEIDEPTCNIYLYTATYFRTDRGHILPTTFDHKFEKWNIPLQHYLNIINIKEFNFSFTHYKKDPLDQIIKYMKIHKKQKHIVILPSRRNRFRKKGTLKRYLKRIHQVYEPSRVLDLVTRTTQRKNSKLLRNNNEGYDVIIACKILDEGYDWPPASVLHNTCYGVSQRKFTQIMYRIFRRYPGKSKIWLYIYMPPLKDKHNIREVYSDRLNIFLASMIMTELCASIKIPLLRTAPFYNDKKGKTSLHEIMEYKHYSKLMSAIATTIDAMEEKDRDNSEKVKAALDLIAGDFYKHVKQHLSPEDYGDAIKAIAIKQIRVSRNKKIEHISISYIRKHGFDKIWKMEKSGSIVYGTKEPLTQKEIYQLRGIVRDAMLYDLKRFSREVREIKTQDHIVKETPMPKTFKVIKDLKKEWILFEIPPKAKWKHDKDNIYSRRARVLDQDGLTLKIALYKGDIEVKNSCIVLTTPGLFNKESRDERYIYCDNYWRSVAVHPSVTPSSIMPTMADNKFLYEDDTFKERTTAPRKIVNIPYEWVKYTL